MTGPSPRNLLGTFLIVSVPSAMFNALVVPDVASATHVAVLAVGIAWPLWCLGNLLATGTSDPGIVRRRGRRRRARTAARARDTRRRRWKTGKP